MSVAEGTSLNATGAHSTREESATVTETWSCIKPHGFVRSGMIRSRTTANYRLPRTRASQLVMVFIPFPVPTFAHLDSSNNRLSSHRAPCNLGAFCEHAKCDQLTLIHSYLMVLLEIERLSYWRSSPIISYEYYKDDVQASTILATVAFLSCKKFDLIASA